MQGSSLQSFKTVAKYVKNDTMKAITHLHMETGIVADIEDIHAELRETWAPIFQLTQHMATTTNGSQTTSARL